MDVAGEYLLYYEWNLPLLLISSSFGNRIGFMLLIVSGLLVFSNPSSKIHYVVTISELQ